MECYTCYTMADYSKLCHKTSKIESAQDFRCSHCLDEIVAFSSAITSRILETHRNIINSEVQPNRKIRKETKVD